MRGGVEALGGVKASWLLALDLPSAPAGSFCSLKTSSGGLMRGLCWVVQDPGGIAKDRSLNVIFPNRLANLLGMELLEL